MQYKKVTKPLLERKRRARINRCLDELKDLMVGALEAEGENVSKLEKADILELTVRHLHRLHRLSQPRDAMEDAHRFQAGFSQCASEACQFLLSLPGLDARVGRRLVAHLSHYVAGPLSVQVPSPGHLAFSPPVSPASPSSSSDSDCASQQHQPVLSSTPSAQDLARPFTGLLMTVNNTGGSAGEHSPPPGPLWRPW
ncbi:enhancer of split mgamma protein [Anabrus simplex]|uniref:enhancer of split mgamma protein n=1 Tax=Anabrus simplex TaxID=316456 RepID=UPI0034DD17DB